MPHVAVTAAASNALQPAVTTQGYIGSLTQPRQTAAAGIHSDRLVGTWTRSKMQTLLDERTTAVETGSDRDEALA